MKSSNNFLVNNFGRDVASLVLFSIIKTSKNKQKWKCLEANAIVGNETSHLWNEHKEYIQVHTNYGCNNHLFTQASDGKCQEEITSALFSNKSTLHPNDIFMLKRFNFIFLECNHNSVNYLDCMFKSILHHGWIVLTIFQDLALYTKDIDTLHKYYNGFITKTYYYKELAVRLILATIIRKAAQINKFAEPMLIYVENNYLTIVLKVSNSASEASSNLKLVRKVIHCELCEDKSFYPDTHHPIEKPYSLLHCNCKSESSGPTAIDMGPIWCGKIFDPSFLSSLLENVTDTCLSTNIKRTISVLLNEAKCVSLQEQDCPESKRSKLDASLECPPFYLSIHRHSPKTKELLKTTNVVKLLHDHGFKASRTHFDNKAVRTNATVIELLKILEAH